MPDDATPKKLWTVDVHERIVVLADTPEQAESIAFRAGTIGRFDRGADSARRFFLGSSLPYGWNENASPYRADGEREQTIGEIRAAAVQEFVDAG